MDIKPLLKDLEEAKKKETYWAETFFCKGCKETHDIHTPFTGHCIVPKGFGFLTSGMKRFDALIKKARKAGFTKKQAEFFAEYLVK